MAFDDSHHHSYDSFVDADKIFTCLDRENVGCLRREELVEGMRRLGHFHISEDQIEDLLTAHFPDALRPCSVLTRRFFGIKRNDFASYIRRHEILLHATFSSLNSNGDGQLTKEDLKRAFTTEHINLTDGDIKIIIKRMHKAVGVDERETVSFDVWRDYLLFHPNSNLHDIVHSLYKHSYIDFGIDTPPSQRKKRDAISGLWWRHFVAGGVAGVLSRTLTAPFDRIKIFFQVHGARKDLHFFSTIRYMLNEGGWACLWRGNLINVMKIAPENAVKFWSYEVIKQMMRGDVDREIYAHERFMAGALAGAVAQTAVFPLEVVRIRMALRKSDEFSGTIDCIRKIFRRSGYDYRVFYRGYFPNLFGIIPYAGIDLTVFETLNRRFNPSEPGKSNSNPLLALQIGALSSSCGQLAAYPFAVVRTKLQSQAGLKIELPSEQTQAYQLFKYIWRTEGVRGFYRGLMPNMCKVAPAMGVSYFVYDIMRAELGIKMT